MDKSLFDRIVQQLLPQMADPAARQALVVSALILAHERAQPGA